MPGKDLRQAAMVILSCYLLAACAPPSSQPFEQGRAQIRVDRAQQLVSIRASDVSVQSLLSDLSAQAGFSLSVPDGEQLGRITLVVVDVPIEEGIHRVLGRTPHTLRHIPDEEGRMVVAAVEVHRDVLAAVGSPGSMNENVVGERASAGLGTADFETADFGWGADQRDDRGSAGNANRRAELALVMETLSVDTVKQLMSEAKDPSLRLSMLDALMERDDQSSVRPLFLDALQDADVTVREAALDHLRGSSGSIPLAVLADAAVNEKDPALRAEMLTLLSEQTPADGRTKDDLAAALTSIQRLLTDPDPLLREQAQWSLEELTHADSHKASR